MNLLLSITEHLKTFMLFPLKPYKVCSDIANNPKISFIILPILLWIVRFFLGLDKMSVKGHHWTNMIVSVFIINAASLFFIALIIYIITGALKSGSGVKANFICVSYVLVYLQLINTITLKTNTVYIFFVPSTLLALYLFVGAISGANKVGIFRGLFICFSLLLLATILSHFLHPSVAEPILDGLYSKGIFSDYVKIALIFSVMAASFLVDSSSKPAFMNAAKISSVFLLELCAIYWMLLFCIGTFIKNPANFPMDFFVKDNSIYYVIDDNGINVNKTGIISGKKNDSKKFDIKGLSYFSNDESGHILLVNHRDKNLSVYDFNDNGNHLFSIDKNTPGCEIKISSFGNRFLVGKNGNYLIACSSSKIRKYSKSGALLSELDIDRGKDVTGNSHPKEPDFSSFSVDNSGNYYIASRNEIKITSPDGATVSIFQYGDKHTFISHIQHSINGNLYAMFTENIREKNKKKVSIKKISSQGKIESETTIYEGEFDNSPTYEFRQLDGDENFVLRKFVTFKREIITFSEVVIMNQSGDIKLVIPRRMSLQNLIVAATRFNDKIINATNYSKIY